ncbi:MAG: LD-carboxypeptidase [Bacteroidetes bacterium]|nr:LD-carboxypeptidase [Bacteroidota bacterium]
MVTPTILKPGDTIGLVSTARKISKEELQPLIQLIESWGLTYRLGTTIEAEEHQFAGDDELRTKDFQQMMDDASIKAIWCARGGYGTVRMVDALNFSIFKKLPKWIIGYSDITVLHSHINEIGIETLHANMAIDIDTKTDGTRESIFNVLFGKEYKVTVAANPWNRSGEVEGILTGGNLSVLYSLLGSPSEVNLEGKILFIEDLDEMLYHIDRMMQNLKRSGRLKDLAGLIVGGMNDMRDNTIPYGKTAERIIFEAVESYDYPVCFAFPAGHINDNRALVMGREVNLNVSEDGSVLQF